MSVKAKVEKLEKLTGESRKYPPRPLFVGWPGEKDPSEAELRAALENGVPVFRLTFEDAE